MNQPVIHRSAIHPQPARPTSVPLRRSLLGLASTLTFGAAIVGMVASVGCNIDQNDLLPSYGQGTGVGTPSTNATGSAASTGAGSQSSTTAGAGGSLPQTAPYTLAVNNASPKIDLADQAELVITVDPKGFTGDVTFSVDNLTTQSGVTGAFTPASATLDGSTAVTTSLILTTASSAPPTALPLTISGTSSAGAKSASATLTINPTITIKIPSGVDGMEGTQQNPNKTAFGDYPTMITAPSGMSAQKPVNVKFFNADSVVHEIHAGQATQGFPHGQGDIQPNSMDTTPRPVNAPGTYDYYLHDQNSALTVGRIVIQ